MSVIGNAWKEENIYNENDFAPIGDDTPKCTLNKILLEEAIKEFEVQNKDIEIVTLHPSLIIGKHMISTRHSQVKAIADLLDGKFFGLPNLYMPLVDLQDVAKAHILALEKEGMAGERFIISQESLSFN